MKRKYQESALLFNIKIFLVLFISILSLQVFPQWTVKNPKNLGIYSSIQPGSLFFLDKNNGWCLGESYSSGAIPYLYSTTNGGLYWQSQILPYKKATEVFFLDLYNGWITGWDGTIINTTDGGKNWNLQRISTSGFLLDIQFVNSDVGWAMGDKTFLITSDGGKNWQHSDLEEASLQMKAMFMLDAQTGWIGTESYSQDSAYLKILKTTDGAKTWKEYKLDKASYGLRKLLFSDSLNGFALTYEVDIPYYSTEDGGATWVLSKGVNLEEYESTTDLFFENPESGWLTTSYGKIFKTTNSGRNWIQVRQKNIFSVDAFYINGNSGLLISGGIYITTDGGLNWEKIDNADPFCDFLQIRVAENSHAIVASEQGVFISDDNGETWDNMSLTSSITYDRGLLALAGNSYIVGESFYTGKDHIFKANTSTNFGQSWVRSPTLWGRYGCISFGSDSVGYIGGDINGLAFARSRNAGLSWELIFSDMSPSTRIYSIFFIDDTLGWIAGYGVIKTTDGGLHWSQPVNREIFIYDVYFYDKYNGWMFSDTVLFRTIDGGDNWMKLNFDTGADIIKRVVFINKKQGYLLTKNNLFKTTDGGTKWTKMEDVPDLFSAMNDMTLAGDNSIWLCGKNGVILRFQDVISAADEPGVQESYQYILSQNYPNPFNPATTIKYTLPKSEFINLKIFDILGNEITTLADEEKQAGIHTVNFDGSNLPSGIYFYQLQAGSFRGTKKLIILK